MDEKPRLNEFEPVSYEAWRKVVEKDLKGADFDRKLVKTVAGSISVQPLYTQDGAKPDAQGLPGEAPFVRGADALGRVEMGWDVRVRETRADAREASAVLEEELAAGASSLTVRLDRSLRTGEGEPSGDGVIAGHVGAFELLFEGINLSKTPVSLEAGANALPAAATLFALASRRNVPSSALSGWLYADPIGTLLQEGNLPRSLEAQLGELTALAARCAKDAPGLRAAVVNTAPYHDAGADAVEELAIAIATGILYLRTMIDGGLTPSDAAKQIGFDFSAGRDFFVSIAMLRAARKLWSRVVEVAGGDAEAQAMRMQVRTSARSKTVRDPWVNMLRGTAESFAAAVGGADSITTLPFDTAIGASDTFSRRMARNTQIILQRESNVHRVADPAGGSWYVEQLTDAIGDAAWKQMQAYESAGGIDKAVLDGSLQARVRQTAKKDAADVSKRKLAVTGVNEFAFLGEKAVERPGQDLAAAVKTAASAAIESKDGEQLAAGMGNQADPFEACLAAAGAGVSIERMSVALKKGSAVEAEKLSPAPYAGVFEALRARSDAYMVANGKRPKVFLANLGSIPQHKARAGFAANFFEAGGFEVVKNDGFADAAAAAEAFTASGAQIACVCSTDDVYAEQAEAAGKALSGAGAKGVLLAGKPADEAALSAAGFTDFIFMGSDAGAQLAALLTRVGA